MVEQLLSIAHGDPLAEEPNIGSLTIPSYCRDVTQRWAGREALVMHEPRGRVSWSYDDLWAQSLAVAKALVAGGIGAGSRVGILMTNRPEHLAAAFGIAMAGGVIVSLSTFSTPQELEYLIQAGAVATLLYDRQVLKRNFSAVLADLEPRIRTAEPRRLRSSVFPFLERLVALDTVTQADAAAPDGKAIETWDAFLASGTQIADEIVHQRSVAVHPSDTGAIFFSSGTTSLPKGIVHAQRALPLQWWRWRRIFNIDAENYPVRGWTGNGLFWSGQMSMMVGLCLTTGGAIILQPVFDADEALTLMERERVSYPNGRPHQWARLQASSKWNDVDLSSLHYVTYGDIIFTHPTVKTDWRICPAFGTTETLTINTAVEANTPLEIYQGSYGRPLPGNTLKIFDPDTGAVVPVGARGEIAIKGPTLMLGYIGKTIEETFDAEGYFCTGDGGYVDERGHLFWEGRLTELIKTGGANVSPIEIDLALAELPGVKRAQTVGVPDALLGEKVVSCVIPHDGVALDPKQLTSFLKERFAAFKIPREILFLTEAEFTVTGSGKVKFQELRKIAAKKLAERSSE